MTKNPFINAFVAIAYIALVACLMFYGSQIFEQKNVTEDVVLMPIAMISLFTLSAAIMGFVFLSTPFQLLVAGDRKGAVKLVATTIGFFALITLILFGVLFFVL